MAAYKLERLFEYLEEEWGFHSKEKFREKLILTIEKISQYPGSCIVVEEFPELRRCVVSRQTSFFYRVLENEIEVVTVVDNRQNPEKIWQEVKEQFSADGDRDRPG